MIALKSALLAVPALLSLVKAQVIITPTNLSALNIGELEYTTAVLQYFLQPPDDLDTYCYYSIVNPLSRFVFLPPAKPATNSSSSNSSSTANATTANPTTANATPANFGGNPFGPPALSKRASSQKLPIPICDFPSGVMSIYATMVRYCNPAEMEAGIGFWHEVCGAANTTLLDLTKFEAAITNASTAAFPQVDGLLNTTGNTPPIQNGVIMSERFYRQSYKSYITANYMIARANNFGFAAVGYWAVIMVAGMIVKFWNFMTTESSWAQKGIKAKPSVTALPGPFATVRHFLRTHVVMPSAFGPYNTHHQRLYFWHTIPKRLDFIIVMGFWVLNILLCTTSYNTFANNVQIRTVPMQYWWYAADRTGIVMTSMLPFLYLFGGRNNIFLWATPFTVQQFNIYHRFIAWVCTILGIGHAVATTVLFGPYLRIYSSNVGEDYFIFGIVALSSMCFLLLTSTAWFRRKFYEPFLNIHIALAIMVCIGTYRHSLKNHLYTNYSYPMWAIWGFDRLLRVVRVVYCNINMRWSDRILKSTHSIVKYDQASDMLLLECYNTANTLNPGPGQYYHIYQPATLTGWENHPFTLGAYTEAPEGPQTAEEKRKLEMSLYDPASKKLTFYIRPYDGWTKRLKNQCLKAGSGTISPKLLVEGPYGHKEPLYAYDNILMIMGGTGIACAIPYILDHIKRAAPPCPCGHRQPTTRTTRIHLVWSVRQEAMIDAVVADSLTEALQRSDIEFSFYCSKSSSTAPTQRMITNPSTTSFTHHPGPHKNADATTLFNADTESHPRKAPASPPKRPNLHIVHGPFGDSDTTLTERPRDLRQQMQTPFADSTQTLTEDTDGDVCSSSESKTASYTVIPRRPDIPSLISNAAWRAEESSSNLAVIMCGPDIMADTCRSSCFDVMSKGFKDIEYFEEAFGW